MTGVRLTLVVTTDDPEVIARVAEQFGRTAAGLALEGVHTALLSGPDDEDDLG